MIKSDPTYFSLVQILRVAEAKIFRSDGFVYNKMSDSETFLTNSAQKYAQCGI